MSVSMEAAAPATVSLRSLCDRPFELLVELERRARVATTGQFANAEQGREWVGISFRLGTENFLVAREETREVLGVPTQLTRVPSARAWIKGLANVRGALLPVIDLRAFLGGGATHTSRSSRILVGNHREIPAGLLIDEVSGFRRFNDGEFAAEVPPTLLRCERYLAGAFRRGTESAPVFSLRTLLESNEFLMGAAN